MKTVRKNEKESFLKGEISTGYRLSRGKRSRILIELLLNTLKIIIFGSMVFTLLSCGEDNPAVITPLPDKFQDHPAATPTLLVVSPAVATAEAAPTPNLDNILFENYNNFGGENGFFVFDGEVDPDATYVLRYDVAGVGKEFACNVADASSSGVLGEFFKYYKITSEKLVCITDYLSVGERIAQFVKINPDLIEEILSEIKIEKDGEIKVSVNDNPSTNPGTPWTPPGTGND